MNEMLRTARFHDFNVGDHFVKPQDLYGLPAVYGEDAEGYSNLRVDCGRRFEVVALGEDWMTARDDKGIEITQRHIPVLATALKVVARPGRYRA